MKVEITQLIERYNSEKGKRYNEEATKNDFILPLFKILGWNVENSNEVSKEENISGKRVDYGFRIDGIPKFFLEAKGLDEDLEGSRMVKGRQVTYPEQAINYAYYKGCNWAILTNFKGIVVYDAWAKSSQSGFRFAIWADSLLNDFDNNLYLLSREAFEQGLLDKKYSTKSRKRPITEQLLLDFTNFRAILSKDVYALNKSKNLTEEELDEAIQRLFDRLIFIRNCEDRELEPYDLLSALRQWKESRKGTLVSKLRELFVHFDDTYNSKIFSKHLCDQVDISDNVLSHVLDGLYTTEDGSILYDFSLIDADVLGNIYEQYLGHILKKTENRTKLTESKAKRKEEGIYYTPSYIVDYIVRNTVGELIKNKKVDVSKIKILDPACGSGSFLIKTFDVLNEYYSKKEGYNQNKLDTSGTGATYSTKLSILKDNIFGVDLDKQAVDIAQLNLLLKVAEKKRRLPILQQNIKNGNSLIDDSNLVGDKAFKWNEEFADIMNNGGFDVVVGNPPYGAELNDAEKDFIDKHLKFSKANKNTALIFIEKALELLKQNGNFGMIVPKSLAYSQLWKSGRQLVKDHLVKIVDVSKAFGDVLLEQVIIILEKNKTANYTIEDIQSKNKLELNKKYIDVTDSIIIDAHKENFKIFEKLNDNCIYLSKISKTSRGLPLQKYLIREKTPYQVIKGKYVSRYFAYLNGEYLPKAIIEKNKKKCDFLSQPKIISQRIVAHVTKPHEHIIIMSSLDMGGVLTVDTVENTILTDNNYSLEFLLCLLNSKLISWYAYRYIFSNAIRTMDLDEYYINKIPIPKSKIDNKIFQNLAMRMVNLKNKSSTLNKTDEKMQIEEKIMNVDKEIDIQIYKLYGITDDEKKVIEKTSI